MKKIISFVFVAIMAAGISSFAGNTATTTQKTQQMAVQLTPEQAKLVDRYKEINAMDKSDLSPSERKDLRKESSDIKSTLKQQDVVVVYISSAVIVVALIILLIILL